MELFIVLLRITVHYSIYLWAGLIFLVVFFSYWWLRNHDKLPQRFWFRIAMLFLLTTAVNMYWHILTEGGEQALVAIVVVIIPMLIFFGMAMFEIAYLGSKIFEYFFGNKKNPRLF